MDQQVIADQLEATTAAYGAASGAPAVLDTVEIGMLGSPATISTVAAALADGQFADVVLDPVLICKGQEPGHALDTDQALKSHILPLATFVTPNHFEAESLSGLEITDVESLKAAAVRIHELSGAAVLAKGGVRLEGPDAVDVYYDGETLEVLSAPKVGEVAVSGAGCSLAAAVTAELAKGATPLAAARTAKAFVTAGIRNRVASGAPFDALWQGGRANSLQGIVGGNGNGTALRVRGGVHRLVSCRRAGGAAGDPAALPCRGTRIRGDDQLRHPDDHARGQIRRVFRGLGAPHLRLPRARRRRIAEHGTRAATAQRRAR